MRRHTLKDTYINSERIKDIKDNVLMDCNEVLNSILIYFQQLLHSKTVNGGFIDQNIGNGIVTFINNDTDQTFVKI